MKRRWPWAVAAALLAGLIVLLLVWRPWAPPRSFVTAEELGYVIEYEIDPNTHHLHQSNPDRDGKEYVGVVVLDHYSVMILDGAVSVSREPRGTVQKGDRLKVTLDRRLWVNGRERKP